jgi:hypothetical protein
MVEIAEAGHMAPLERPGQVAAVTLAALAQASIKPNLARPSSFPVPLAAL